MKNTLKLIPAALLSISMVAQAAVTVTIKERGNDVVVVCDGAINTMAGLSLYSGDWSPSTHVVNPSIGLLVATGTENLSYFVGFDVPASAFGDGGETWASSAVETGSGFALLMASGIGMGIPRGYTLGDPIQCEMTFANTSIANLGFNEGTFVYPWGNDVERDFVTLRVASTPKIPTPVPTLGALGLMGLAGAIGAAGVAMTRRRKK